MQIMKMGVNCTMMVVMMLSGVLAWGEPDPNDTMITWQEPHWCVAKPNSSEAAVHDAIHFVCGKKAVDCSPIAHGGACYFPRSLYNHASFVMNRYYQLHARNARVCNFRRAGMAAFSNPNTPT
ncbi:hypothetical protein MRB53_028831 [Persea americana]|uniref:Uncharacterized protein n=1 Tax=Persea americana TaxID=3435 RepID=A0ACC2KH10_PERAE|nr:hypothetical protein MRB53_028831 [Persea americana]